MSGDNTRRQTLVANHIAAAEAYRLMISRAFDRSRARARSVDRDYEHEIVAERDPGQPAGPGLNENLKPSSGCFLEPCRHRTDWIGPITGAAAKRALHLDQYSITFFSAERA